MKLKPTVVICLCSLVSVFCFAVYGYTGMDYPFHLSSWMDYSAAWKSGVFLPGWAAHANYGLGEPRFYFYPPLSLWLGSLLYLILPLKIVPAVFVWVAFCIAGFSMYALSGLLLAEEDRIKAAALYTLSYFLLVTADRHFAVAELLTDALLPLLCYFLLKVLLHKQRIACAGLAIGLAIAWQTDIPAAIDIAYTFFIGAGIWCVIRRKPWAFFLQMVAQLLGILLSAWYLLPAFLAKKQIGSTAQLNYEFRYLFSRVHTSIIDHTLSLSALIAAIVLVYCLLRLRKQENTSDGLLILISLGLIAFFFQLPFSQPLWSYLPDMKIVGFPFRFQSFLAIALPPAVFLLRRARWLQIFIVVFYVAFALFPLWSYRGLVRQLGPSPSIERYAADLTAGSPGMPEYTPAGTGAVALKAPVPTGDDVSSAAPGCVASVKTWEPEHRQVKTSAPMACSYQLRLYSFPFWHVFSDGKSIPASSSADGRLLFTIPAGNHAVEIRFHRPFEPLLAGIGISIVAVLGLSLLISSESPRTER